MMAQGGGTIELPMREASKRATLTVKLVGVRSWTWRLRVSVWIFRLGAMVCPIGVVIAGGEDDHEVYFPPCHPKSDPTSGDGRNFNSLRDCQRRD
jgi:hypothetical protein